MAYADLLTIQTLNTGDILTAAAMTQVRNNGEFLIDPPACSIKETTAQSVPDGVLTALTSNEENFDSDSMHSVTTSTSRITMQTAGRYLLVATVEFASNVTGHRQFEFLLNGSAAYGLVRVDRVSTGNATLMSGARPFVFTAGQYAELRVLHIAGVALNVTMLDFSAYYLSR